MAFPPVVLVLCTGNSCRSQMAEGFLREYASQLDIHSAGTVPAAQVHPLAVQVMKERGIDISGQHPKSVREYLGKLSVRYLIVVCHEAEESCPRIFPGLMTRVFWPLEDPAAFEGSQSEKIDKFREIRDEIESYVKAWLAK